MREILQNWINDADNFRHLRHFNIAQLPIELAHLGSRLDDYYISLVGELFKNLHEVEVSDLDWSQLGNAFLQFSLETTDRQLRERGISKDDAALFAATSFYFGDFPASACLAMRQSSPPSNPATVRATCFDFLARPAALQSELALMLQSALKDGSMDEISKLVDWSQKETKSALEEGPQAWIEAKLMENLLARFNQTNLRAVLPNGEDQYWTPLIHSLVSRQPSTWEFFPSQIQAIQGGLLQNVDSYAMQMPTGAGKTTLCETLLFSHLSARPQDAAILLVPYRSLASELRGTLVRRLNAMGLSARCAYGGTVPSGDEIHGLDEIRALVATPESLSGVLSADLNFSQRISLVICDEGHLLDSGGRGIGLELLLARMRSRPENPPRVVFVSAIVPNIEEINAWLGGNENTVIRSTYQPATNEFAILQPTGRGARTIVHLNMHPHEIEARKFTIEQFLKYDDFRYFNPATGRAKTYRFASIKSQAVAAARKVLPMGMTAIFAANKRGRQGAVGLAEELVKQLSLPLRLPSPKEFAQNDNLQRTVAYLENEYGAHWIGAGAVNSGAVLHHGDIPQETREVLETLIREGSVRLVICTSTLAEGVNLPMRSLVLYSVQRRNRMGQSEAMLARDIKNLVGRAGRAGANTKGLVICANPDQWHLVQPVATQEAGEPVRGSLRSLIQRLNNALIQRNLALSNDILESNIPIHPVVDGVDSTLIDLISEEVGEEAFVAHARQLAEQTFAARQLPQDQANLLRDVFELRARRLITLRHTGQLAWIRDTGTKVRLLDSVEQILRPSRDNWQDPIDPLDDELRTSLLEWAWEHQELKNDIVQTFRPAGSNPDLVRDSFFELVRLWMAGASFLDLAEQLRLDMDDLLAIHSRAITFSLQSLIEHGIGLLARSLQAEGAEIAAGVTDFSEHLRFGAPNMPARMLASIGVRHRKAYVALGNAIMQQNPVPNTAAIRNQAQEGLRQHSIAWREELGELVYANTLKDLA